MECAELGSGIRVTYVRVVYAKSDNNTKKAMEVFAEKERRVRKKERLLFKGLK